MANASGVPRPWRMRAPATPSGSFVPLGFGAGQGARLVQRSTGKHRPGAPPPVQRMGTWSFAGWVGCRDGRAPLDSDGDGGLNAAELTVWLTHPVPDTELSVALEPAGYAGHHRDRRRGVGSAADAGDRDEARAPDSGPGRIRAGDR